MALSCTQINLDSFILLEIEPGFDPRTLTDRMFKLTVIIGSNSFTKSIGKQELLPMHQLYAKSSSIAEYVKLTAKGLREHCELLSDNGSVTVKWFKPLQGNEGLKSILGLIQIQQDSSFSITAVLTKLTKSHSSLMTKIQDLKQQSASSAKERDECLAKFEEVVAEKERTDAQVFKKFAVLLNAKKQKIRTLMSSQ